MGDLGVLGDEDLVLGGVLDLVSENRASARRWARLVELHRRRPDTGGPFPMSGRDWVASEVSEAWAMGDQHTRTQLNVALFLVEHLPEVWEMCQEGSLDRFRASMVADVLRHRLDDPEVWASVGARVTAFLRKYLRVYPGLGVELVTCSTVRLRNRLTYEVRRIVTADEEYARDLEERAVHTFEVVEGVSRLSLTGRTDQVLLAEHRLRLAAKSQRAAGDPRTVEQLMSDLALDLLIGRAEGLPVPGYARPVINVTVSLETLAGIAEDPGQLSGGTVIPADLARAIATSEGATWFRLLTDPVGDPVALSTKSYQPTTTIWRHVVATQPTCAHPGCDRPSVLCELDHRDPWPTGQTSTANLDPLCKRHHRVKHARAQRADLDWEYGQAS